MGELEGLTELFARLDGLASTKNIEEGLNDACVRIEVAAKENCPVDDGTLRASITHNVDISKLQGEIGSNVEYAPYVEFGTGLYAIKGNGRKTPWKFQDAEGNWHYTAGMHPQPFLEKALEDNKEQIVNDIAKAIKGGMGK